MGSDDGDKDRTQLSFRLLRWSACCRSARNVVAMVLPHKQGEPNTDSTSRAARSSLPALILGALASLWVFLVVLFRLLPPPELLLSPTFTMDQAHVPEQCEAVASDFFRCQQQPSKTLVLACHRRWCNSWGFCEPCEGLGDRMRFMLSQVNEAMANAASGRAGPARKRSIAMDTEKGGERDSCTRIQLDYPVQDVATLDTAVYQDPAGWWGHLFRKRSYSLGKKFHKEDDHGGSSYNGPHHLRLTRPSTGTTNDLTVTHFSPDHYFPKDYDPCYFHLLFQPSPSLQADITRHLRALMQESSSIGRLTASDPERALPLPSIGIHLRTGDVTAFGIDQNDTRVKGGDLALAWSKMLQCADDLSRDLFPSHSPEQIPYFVATDNLQLKGWIASGQHERSVFEGSTEKKRIIYTTDVTPRSSWQAWEGDRDAWMELYLLSMQSGLVVNVRPSGYAGGAGRTSFFSVLAQKVGFMSAHRVRECVLE